ncbi:MAG: hypothetical protein HY263_09000 [Chloroflexi bacterium]|nr:hypothetical protein [Chloroflexota bacterium]
MSQPTGDDRAQRSPSSPAEGEQAALLHDAADRFAGLARFVATFGEPNRVAKLVEVLNAGDAASFRELIRPYGAEPACGMMCHVVVEVLSTGAAPELVEVCTLRTDLTLLESYEVFRIARAHFGAPTAMTTTPPSDVVNGVSIPGLIPPGAYLDELKAAGLVKCWHIGVPGHGLLSGSRDFVCAPLCR